MAISSIEQSTGWANFDAVATLRTVEPAAVGTDNSICSASAGFNSVLAHPLIANTRASFAENAALRVVCHHGRKILFGIIVFLFGETLFESAPIKRHLLQFALTTAIADGTIERMIGKQKFEHRTLRFFNFLALSSYDHPVSADDRAGGLQFGHLLDAYQAHAAGSLQCEVGVIAERWDVKLLIAADIDEPSAFGHCKLFTVDGYFNYVSCHLCVTLLHAS